MYSKGHLAISVLVGAIAALAMGVDPMTGTLLVGYAAVVGVAIDLDHFLIARLNAGDFRALRACLRDPALAFLNQSRIFDESEVTELERLLSHHVVAGVAVAGLAFASLRLALFTGVILYAHVVTDLLWDVRRSRRSRERRESA